MSTIIASIVSVFTAVALALAAVGASVPQQDGYAVFLPHVEWPRPDLILFTGDEFDIYVVDPDQADPPALIAQGLWPRWSHDGKRVIYRRTDANTYESVTRHGQDVQYLFTLPDGDVDVRWSPAGDKVAFSRLRQDPQTGHFVYDLYLMDPDGANPQRLTEAGPYAWNYDGTLLVFQRYDGGDSEGLFAFHIPTGSIRSLAGPCSGNLHFSVSPVSNQIAFGCTAVPGLPTTPTPGIFLVQGDGSNLRQLTGGADYGAAFSPDGSRIVFFRDTSNAVARQPMIVNVDGSNEQPVLAQAAALAGWVTWSPDSTQLAFVEFMNDVTRSRRTILVAAVGGGSPRRLFDFGVVAGFIENPQWSP